MSDVLKPSRKTPPPEIAALSPPLSPKSEKADLKKSDDVVPIDINIPDNYVQHTLKTQKELPPIGWHNWWKEISWVSTTVLTVTPTIAIVGAFYASLQWKTALFAVFYYFVTGLGITAGE